MGKTQEQLESLRNEYVARGVSNGNTHIADFAKGATVTDKDGKEWIDFAGAIGTLNVGHSHPKITEHLKTSLKDLFYLVSM